jgi:hypothetical protein
MSSLFTGGVMSLIPRVAEYTRERICREFDNLGPDTCRAEISQLLNQSNPELLDMATKCAVDVSRSSGEPEKVLVGFCMFYRLLLAQAAAARDHGVSGIDGANGAGLPRVTLATRNLIVKQIDEAGSDAFTRSAIADLEHNNPELLYMADDFASRHEDYLGVMQGFALLYSSLIAQCAADRLRLN